MMKVIIETSRFSVPLVIQQFRQGVRTIAEDERRAQEYRLAAALTPKGTAIRGTYSADYIRKKKAAGVYRKGQRNNLLTGEFRSLVKVKVERTRKGYKLEPFPAAARVRLRMLAKMAGQPLWGMKKAKAKAAGKKIRALALQLRTANGARLVLG